MYIRIPYAVCVRMELYSSNIVLIFYFKRICATANR